MVTYEETALEIAGSAAESIGKESANKQAPVIISLFLYIFCK